MTGFAQRPTAARDDGAHGAGSRHAMFLDEEPAAPAPAAPAGAAPVTAPATPADPTAALPWLAPDLFDAAPRLPAPHQAAVSGEVNRRRAEQLLTTGDLLTPEVATDAMESLIAIPAAGRGRALDAMDDTAFARLLEYVPPDKREQFHQLLGGISDPKRKLKLWSQAHESRARNDVARLKGDVGPDDPNTEAELAGLTAWPAAESDEGEYEQEAEPAEDAGPAPAKRSAAQDRNLARHRRRVAATVSTHGEVDAAQTKLLAKAKGLSLADVDALIERKELEYGVEREHNLNLTSEGVDYNGGRYAPGAWSKSELELVQATLQRLPEEHVRDTFSTINRVSTPHLGDMTRGLHRDDTVHILDAANAGFGAHDGDPRTLAGDAMAAKHGATVQPLENVLTHELGHDVAARHPAAFAAFQKAGGWNAVDVDALERDGLSPEAIEQVRNSKQTFSGGHPATSDSKYYTKNVLDEEHAFWAQDKTAIPRRIADQNGVPDPAPESLGDGRGNEMWGYAKSNPSEHFADVYQKAVQAPTRLHADLVSLPQKAAATARKELDAASGSLAGARREKAPDPAQVAALEREVAAAEAKDAYARRAAQQRGEQFDIMRNDVFHTDEAARLSAARLKFMNVPAARIAEFEQAAVSAATPDQIAVLERRYTP